jgi:hypothetical protein
MAGGLPVMAWWVVVGKKKLLLWLKEAKRRFSTFGRSLDYSVHSVSSSKSLIGCILEISSLTGIQMVLFFHVFCLIFKETKRTILIH